jgi:hypothetical protein
MKRSFRQFGLITAIVLTLFAFIAVKASSSCSISFKKINTGSFPMVQLDLNISGETSGLFAKNFSISENGKVNNGPIILLPPKPFNNKIDLFVLLDTSGNTQLYEPIIQSNLRSLMDYMEALGIDYNIYLTSFGYSDSPEDQIPENFPDNVQFGDRIDGIAFDASKPNRVYGLNKIYNFTSVPSRPDAQKVALVVNGSQFYDIDRGEDTTYSKRETINQLVSGGFDLFVIGYPLKQVNAVQTGKVEDASLSHSVSGGYIGSFGSDLTVLADILKNRSSDKFTLVYYSGLLPLEASGSSVQIYIQNSPSGSFNYPSIDPTVQKINHTTANEVILGDPVDIGVKIDTFGKLVDLVEMFYLDKNNAVQKQILNNKRDKMENGAMVYEGFIDKNDYPEDYVRYYVRVHTPYNVIGAEEDTVSIPVFAYDNGIVLRSTVVNNTDVLWSWSGKTVDMGTEYELYAGDDLVIKTTARNFSIPVTECNRYQIVKLRVHLKDNADHPRAGEWSLFSRPGERFVGEDGPVTEKQGIEKMFECLKSKSAISFSSFVTGENNYQPDRDLYLEKMLYYLTGVIGQSIRNEVRYDRYRLLYYIMNFISYNEYTTYEISSSDIPISIVYKVITNTNQTSDIYGAFKKAMDELVRRMRGSLTL